MGSQEESAAPLRDASAPDRRAAGIERFGDNRRRLRVTSIRATKANFVAYPLPISGRKSQRRGRIKSGHAVHQCHHCLCMNATAASRSNVSRPGSIHTSQSHAAGPTEPINLVAPDAVPVKCCHQKNGVSNVQESP